MVPGHPPPGTRPPIFLLSAFVASFCLVGLQQIREADAQGFLLSPQSRNIQSYYGPELPGKEYTPQGLQAGGPGKVKLGGGGLAWPHGKYGACGDPYDAQTQKWLVPREKTTYIKGSTIQVQAVVTAYHKGRFGFSICPYASDGAALEACFQRPESIMTRADGVHPGEPYLYLESIRDGAATKTPYPGTDAFMGKDTYTMTYRLPAGLECSHCVMRWHYLTGNSCQLPCNPADPHWDASDPETGCDVNKMGVCGTSVDMAYPEEFWNCADIEITSGGGQSSSPPPPSPAPVSSPSSPSPSTITSSPLPPPPSTTALSDPPPPSPVNPGPECNQGSDPGRAACFCQDHPFGQFTDVNGGCNGFFDCYEGGTAYTACQPGLLYDEAISACNWASDVTCQGAGQLPTSPSPPSPVMVSSPPPPASAPVVVASPSPPPPASPPLPSPVVAASPLPYPPAGSSPSPSTDSSSPQPPPPPSVGPSPCENGSDLGRASCFCAINGLGQFPDTFKGCVAYFDCSANIAAYQPCPGGLLFDASKKYCDWPNDVTCNGPATTASPPPFPPPAVVVPSPSPPPPDVGFFPSPPPLTSAAVPSPPSPPPSGAPNPGSLPVPSPPSPPPSGAPNPDGLPLQVEAALQNTNYAAILRSQQPDLTWALSSIYFWPDLVSALTSMHVQGVGGSRFWLGDTSANGYKYGLESVAAFLAQSMKETIQYDACDENNWDSTSGYTASNACGQLGQSYQNYNCPAGQEQYQCEVDPEMSMRANTHAKWYGAPPAFFCAPKATIQDAPKWSNGGWCNPAENPDTNVDLTAYLAYVKSGETCRDYPGQKADKWQSCGEGAGCANAAAPAFGQAARTDVEGCCWWGRGVIQTTGICNFGKLNYFLGARAAREGRTSLFPDIDFCKDPQAICSSTQYPQLKWIAGLYYYLTEVQPWNAQSFEYEAQLCSFVDGGMSAGDTTFIDGVSGIVNRGCPGLVQPCPAGPVDGLSDRRTNFRTVLQAMHLEL